MYIKCKLFQAVFLVVTYCLLQFGSCTETLQENRTMAPVVERVAPSVELGEGPHWDVATQSLYYVDIFGKAIHRYVPATKKHTKAIIGTGPVSLIIPVEGQKDKYLISIGRTLAVVTWDGESDKVSDTVVLAEVDNTPDTLDNRFNDGKCDPSGRLWAGTMGGEPVLGQVKQEKAALFTLDNKQIKTHLTKIGISNGLAWTPDNKTMYYIDSHKGYVEQFDFDINKGTISNSKIIFTPAKHGIDGALDGMTIDTDGNLWIAIFNGYRVIQIDPRKPETLLQTIPIPAKQTTSVAFGGPNLDELYVTSASFTVGGVELPPPDHGATFKVTGTGAKGYPAVNFVFKYILEMVPMIEKIAPKCTLGEGPHWDAATQSLYYVDVMKKAIHKYVPSTKKHTQVVVGPDNTSIVIPIEGKPNKFVVTTGRKLAVVTWDGQSDKISDIEVLAEATSVGPFNDGKCDPSGRLWAGTLGHPIDKLEVKNANGSLYSWSNNELKAHLSGISIANGLAWSMDKTLFYYIDSSKGYVEQFDFDVKNGKISNGKVIFTLAKHGLEGILDGMTIDTNGNLWIAVFNGSCVIQIDPRKPETLLETIAMPVKQVTSVTFGGANLDELYVTSGSWSIDDEDLSAPEHGATFRITGLGVKGLTGVPVKL
ncbi:uncharacterized protein LOC109599228 [Aethina tumida]|uniref:uncharacterized protein LOC109599228 n=1 Tax=Aethina tumida TaxID=116153 RepID=UPI0021476236|nr:uncharacterized protein LOC109599228 [Aethina tumida]